MSQRREKPSPGRRKANLPETRIWDERQKGKVDLLLRNKHLGPRRAEILSWAPISAPPGTNTSANHLVSLSFLPMNDLIFFSRVWHELTVHVQLKKDIKHQGVLHCLHQKLKDHEPGHPNQEIHKNNKSVFPFISLPVLYLLCAFSRFSLLWELDS